MWYFASQRSTKIKEYSWKTKPAFYSWAVRSPSFLELSILSTIRHCTDHTWADDSCILLMTTVVSPPAPGRALPHLGLIPSTVHVIHPDAPWSCPEVSRPHSTEGFSTAQLPAHHVGIVQVPVIITDGAPGALVKNLHSPGTASTPIHQAELSAVWGERNGTIRCWERGYEGSSGAVGLSSEVAELACSDAESLN